MIIIFYRQIKTFISFFLMYAKFEPIIKLTGTHYFIGI